MLRGRVPERLQWAVQMLAIAPGDEVLEIGCGPGLAISLVCDRLGPGRITGIDRSATAIKRATERNAEHVASGKALLRHVELANLEGSDQPFDKVFAVNVNLIWVRPADAEVRIIRNLMRDNAILSLFYETPGPEKANRVAKAVRPILTSHDFSTATATGNSPSLICITARLLP